MLFSGSDAFGEKSKPDFPCNDWSQSTISFLQHGKFARVE
jgi:hypothetical protein